MLGRVIGEYWLALVRDVLALGYRAEDILTELTVADMCAIACAAPPGSAVRSALDGGWSREAQLLANMSEQNAGIAQMTTPYQRPGIEARSGWGGDDDKIFHGDAMTWEEFDELEAKRAQHAENMAAAGVKPTNTKVRTF
jgi:hypothetical protein